MNNVIFFGSAKYFSSLVLEKVLSSRFSVLSVVTTPDKPAGRHLQLTPNPVKQLAQKHNIPVYENITPLHFPPLKLRGGTEEGDIETPVGLVAAYGKIILQSVIDAFGGRIYNVHPSLLPKYRGPSPLQQQILDGATQTGVTIIQLDAEMDHGPIVAQAKDIIRPDDTWINLGERLFALGADAFIKFLLNPKPYTLTPQDHSQATYTKKLTRESGFIPWEQFKSALNTNPYTLDPNFRALSPWPGVWTLTPSGQRLKLVSLSPLLVQPEGQTPQPPNFPKV